MFWDQNGKHLDWKNHLAISGRLLAEFWWCILSGSRVCDWGISVPLVQYIYSKTFNIGPSEKWTTSEQWTAHLPLIDFTIELILFEPPRSGHLSTDTDQPPTYLGQYKITSENVQWSYTHPMWMLVNHFVMPTSLDSKTKHYISTVALLTSLSCQCKATERSEMLYLIARSTARPITPTGSIPNAYNGYLHIPAHSGSPFHCSLKMSCYKQSSVYLDNSCITLHILC